MKKISIICCFILITLFSAGSYLIYSCYLNSYKQEFQTFVFKVHQQTASIILINPSELYTNSINVSWEDGNKEVVYKGVLYDIVRIENKGMKVALVAVSDDQEMSLKKQFAEIFDSTSGKSTKNPYYLLKNFFALKCLVNNAGFNLQASSLCSFTARSSDSFQILPIFLSRETPPPDQYL